MRRLCAACALLVLASCGKRGGGGGSAAKGGPDTGFAECDAFLVQYRCFLSKNMPAADVDNTINQMAKAWKQASDIPEAHDAVAASCKQQLASQAATFARAGCVPGSAPPPDSPPPQVAPPGRTPPSGPANGCTRSADCASGLRCCAEDLHCARSCVDELCRADADCIAGKHCFFAGGIGVCVSRSK